MDLLVERSEIHMNMQLNHWPIEALTHDSDLGTAKKRKVTLTPLQHGKRTLSSTAGNKGCRKVVGAVGCKQLIQGEEEPSARQCRNADEQGSVGEAFHPSQAYVPGQGMAAAKCLFPWPGLSDLLLPFFLRTRHGLLFVHRKMTVA